MNVTTQQMKEDIQQTLNLYDSADLALLIIKGKSAGKHIESIVLDGSLRDIVLTIACNMVADESLEKVILCAAELFRDEKENLKKFIKERTKKI